MILYLNVTICSIANVTVKIMTITTQYFAKADIIDITNETIKHLSNCLSVQSRGCAGAMFEIQFINYSANEPAIRKHVHILPIYAHERLDPNATEM